MDKKTEKEVLDILKNQGLDIAEATAVQAVKAAFSLMLLLVPKISKGLGQIIIPLVMYAEAEVLALVDKIDGQDNPDY